MADKLQLTREEFLQIENFKLKIDMAQHLLQDLQRDMKIYIESLYQNRKISPDEYELNFAEQRFVKKENKS